MLKNMTNTPKFRVLNALNTYADQHGFSPTLTELKNQLGYSSKGAVMYHVNHLVENGLLHREPLRHRTLKLTKKGQKFLSANGTT